MLTRAQTKQHSGLVHNKQKPMISDIKILENNKNLNFNSVSTKQESYRMGACTTHENSMYVNDGY